MKKRRLNHRELGAYRERISFPLRSLCPLWLTVLVFTACIPAQTPPILDATPGAGAVITADTYRSASFSLRYPSGWRVITSQAGASHGVTLVAPGDCALILVSSAPIEQPLTSPACAEPDIQTITRSVALENGEIGLAGSAPAAEWQQFLSAFNALAASISTP